MNYFELFELPVQLTVDKDYVRKKYFSLSRQFHPDYFVNKTPEEQKNALESSALLNKAFKTFQSKDETIRYVLMLKGLLADEEKYELSPDFLMQMMEVNEELAEAQLSENETATTKIYQQLTELEKEIYEPVEKIVANYQDGVTTQKELLQVKDYYFKKKYIHRLAQQLNQKL